MKKAFFTIIACIMLIGCTSESTAIEQLKAKNEALSKKLVLSEELTAIAVDAVTKFTELKKVTQEIESGLSYTRSEISELKNEIKNTRESLKDLRGMSKHMQNNVDDAMDDSLKHLSKEKRAKAESMRKLLLTNAANTKQQTASLEKEMRQFMSDLQQKLNTLQEYRAALLSDRKSIHQDSQKLLKISLKIQKMHAIYKN